MHHKVRKMEKGNYLFTSESVSEGHPDKVCDQISDAVLDAFLKEDGDSHVAVETLVTTGQVVVAGEVRCNGYVDIPSVVRGTIARIGYTNPEYGFEANSCGVLTAIHEQSPDINQGVSREDEKKQGAGDQGLVFGFATDETETYMPVAHYLATLIVQSLAEIRKEGKLMRYLRPDSKSQVTVEYSEFDEPLRIDTIVVSTQHDEFASEKAMQETIRHDVINTLIPYVKAKIKDEKVLRLFNEDIKYFVNPTGKFVIGGPAGDTGLTGRKIIVDTYGGMARHGGGAFCVDGDTEYLSPDGWKKISEYNGGKVAQWDNGELTFVEPLVYHKHKAEKMYRLTTKHFLDMVLSENHNVVFETSKGNIIKKRVKDLVDNDEIANGNAGFIPISFKYAGGDGIDMTDDEIRLQVAFCADGTLKGHSPYMNLKKFYKKERIIDLLEITQTEYDYSEYDDGYMRVRFEPKIKSKSLVECFKGASLHQLNVIAGELKEWDGDCDNVYRTTIKKDADFAQFVFMASSGKYASIRCDDRIGETYGEEDQYTRNSICYSVRQCDCKTTNIRRTGRHNTNYVKVEDFVPSDGMMYCFTVPSTMLVLRRNDKVFVTGNCGKDSSKVDRSAAYAARYVAKNLVANGICSQCEIQIGYAIGVAEPVSVYVNDFGTYNGAVGDLGEFVREHFDLSPYGIDKMLGGLKKPIYLPTAAYGHFGREPYEKDGLTFFPWEKVMTKEELLSRKKY